MRRPHPYLVLLAAVLAVSWAAPLIRLTSAPPLAIAAWRLTFASLVLLPLFARPSPRAGWRALGSRERWIAALAGVVDQQTAQGIVASFQAVAKDLTQLLGDSSKLVLLVIPVATVYLAKIGYSSASPSSQVASVQAMAPKQLTAAVQAVAPRELVAATQALPAAQVTVSDPTLASPGVKIGAV